ncbi:MAG TPA: metallophosphoesterase [Nitrososphaera sp.]|nr:metallophosphoesterase [Nitrososphaera sp.]
MSLNRGLFASILDLRSLCKGKKVTIIGDIHGCYDELNQLLDTIDWSPNKHILILTGDLIDRGPKIRETLMFAMTTPSVYSLMSNHEHKLLRYIQGRQVQTTSLAKTIQQCGEAFLRDPSLSKWLESLPWIVRFANSSYVVHAGIRPDRPIDKQRMDHCIYMRTWNPKTRKISNEGIDPWWYEYPYLYSSQRHHSAPSIRIFFGHQRQDKAWVSHWACALDGGVVFGGTLRAYTQDKGIIEIEAERAYERDERKRLLS